MRGIHPVPIFNSGTAKTWKKWKIFDRVSKAADRCGI